MKFKISKYSSYDIPTELHEAINANMATFQKEVLEPLDAKVLAASKVISEQDGVFVCSLKKFLDDARDEILKIEDKDHRESAFEAINDATHELLGDYSRNDLEFELDFGEEETSLEYWEPSTC